MSEWMLDEILLAKTPKQIENILDEYDFEINSQFSLDENINNINTKQTLLTYLCGMPFYDHSYDKTIKLLLKCNNIDINKCFGYKEGPLTTLIVNRRIPYDEKTYRKHNDLIDLFLSHPNIDVDHQQLKDADSPYIVALQRFIELKFFEKIVKLTKNINVCFYSGIFLKTSAIEYLCKSRQFGKLEILIANGACVTPKMVQSFPDTLKNWKQWLPKWSYKTHQYFPKELRKHVFVWMCIANSFNLCKDLKILVVKFIVKEFLKN